jgi:hypothetical protein
MVDLAGTRTVYSGSQVVSSSRQRDMENSQAGAQQSFELITRHVVDGIVELQVQSSGEQQLNVQVYCPLGEIKIIRTVKLRSGTNTIRLDAPSFSPCIVMLTTKNKSITVGVLP